MRPSLDQPEQLVGDALDASDLQLPGRFSPAGEPGDDRRRQQVRLELVRRYHPHQAEPPRRDYPPLRISWFSSPWWSKGIETHTLDGVPVRKHDPAKSVAETLKYHTGLRTCLLLRL